MPTQVSPPQMNDELEVLKTVLNRTQNAEIVIQTAESIGFRRVSEDFRGLIMKSGTGRIAVKVTPASAPNIHIMSYSDDATKKEIWLV
jgi:hypothetical protein